MTKNYISRRRHRAGRKTAGRRYRRGGYIPIAPWALAAANQYYPSKKRMYEERMHGGSQNGQGGIGSGDIASQIQSRMQGNNSSNGSSTTSSSGIGSRLQGNNGSNGNIGSRLQGDSSNGGQSGGRRRYSRKDRSRKYHHKRRLRKSGVSLKKMFGGMKLF